MPYRVSLAAVLILGTASAARLIASDLKPQARMEIVRGLMAEYATLRSPLPRGEKGLLLKSDGQIDQENLRREITQKGTALPQNVLVQITNIVFRDREILVEINGGGKRKSKWYEHVEVGTGYGTTPISNPNSKGTATGSMITLAFPQKLPDLSVEQVKEHLAPVLDFSPVTPIQAMSRPIPPEFKEAVESKQAVVGMDRDTVLAAIGQPDNKVRETKNGLEQEDWIYGKPPLKVIFVTFEGEEVVDVQEYTGGVSGQAQTPPEAPPR